MKTKMKMKKVVKSKNTSKIKTENKFKVILHKFTIKFVMTSLF